MLGAASLRAGAVRCVPFIEAQLRLLFRRECLIDNTVSKTVVRVTVPWVRIPPSPPASPLFFQRNSALRNCHENSAV
jgi:hypothetical protein